MNDTVPLIELRLLGAPELRLADIAVDSLRRPLLLQLLAYVALDGPVRRDDAAALLWPEAAASRRLPNLRQLLHWLRKQAGAAEAGLWDVSAETLMLAAPVVCDVRLLLATSPTGTDHATLLAAAGLYRGELLAGLTLPDGAFLAWVEEARLRCREHAGRLFFRLAELALQRGDFSQALQAARNFAELRPDDEENVRALIRKLTRENRGAMAEEVFHVLEQTLVRDFGRMPEPETRRLAHGVGAVRKQTCDELEWHQTTLLLVAPGIVHSAHGEEDEESRALVADGFSECLQSLLERYGAYVIGLPGGLTIGYFGFPSGMERSLDNACRALTEIKRELPELSEARCVLHCGKALASERMPDSSGRLTGSAMRLAERLAPGCVLITEAAQNLLMLPDSRPFQAGDDLPVAFLIDESSRRIRGGALVPPCLGREAEIRLLRSQHQVSLKGELVAVLVTGEAGIGKTRLVQSLRAAIGGVWLEAHCDPLFSETPFFPLWEMLTRDDPDGVNRSLRELMRRQLPEMPLQWRDAPPKPVTREAHAILLGSLARVIRLAAAQQPFVLLVEDLHWADASILALLNQLIDHPQRTPCLLLLTARHPPAGLERSRSLGVLNLPPLDEAAARLLLQFHRPDIDDQKCREAVRLCAGNPFYLNEMARSGTDDALPGSLQAALLGRVEALGKEAKRFAQIAALLGLSMERKWLETLAGSGTSPTSAAGENAPPLQALLHGGILVENGDFELTFRHALIQRAIEESLPARRKMELYAKIGADFVKHFLADAERLPERVAHWLTQGSDWESALPWRLMAGQKALAYQASGEAMRHWRAALELLERLPDENKFAVWEKDIRSLLGPAVIVATGFGAQSAENYSRLAQLCHRLNDRRGEIEALWGMKFFEETRAGQRVILPLLRRMRAAGVALGETRLQPKILESHLHCYLVSGQLHKARALEAENYLAGLDAAGEKKNTQVFHDPLIGVQVRLGWLAWMTGDWRAMYLHSETAVELARAKGEHGSIAIALAFSLYPLLLAGRGESARSVAAELQRLSDEKELVIYRGYALANSGYAEALCGNAQEAITLLENGLAIMERILPCHRGKFILRLAEVLAHEGRHVEAQQRLQQAAEQIARYGEFFLHIPYQLARVRIRLAAAPEKRVEMLALLDKAQRIAKRENAPAFALQVLLEKSRQAPECAATRAALQQLVDSLPDHPLIPDLQTARKLLG